MSARVISLYQDERWYKAISDALGDETLEDHLDDVLDELCSNLPSHIYQKISREIYQENHQDRMPTVDAPVHRSVFQITENGDTHCYLVDRPLKFLDAARLMRMYLSGERGASSFAQMLWNAREIRAEQFDALAQHRVPGTDPVTGAFELDFDRDRMRSLQKAEGWRTYSMQEVSSAVRCADRERGISADRREERFTERLDGQALEEKHHWSGTGPVHFSAPTMTM